MSKILKFPNKKSPYSDRFLSNVKPNAIGDFILKQNPNMSLKAADAMALAIVYSTYLQLVFEEEGEKVPMDVLRKFEENDHDTFMWARPKHTLH